MNQEALRSRLFIELDCVSLDARAVAGDLKPEQIGWKPPTGGWSIGQVFEHLIVANDSYINVMRGLIYARNAPHTEDGNGAWEPSLAGWLLVGSFRSKRKQTTPGIYSVAADLVPRANVVSQFLDRQQMLIDFLRAASALDWKKVRFSSPVHKWIRVNLGDGFMILTVHAQRHIKQMERVRDLAEFPR